MFNSPKFTYILAISVLAFTLWQGLISANDNKVHVLVIKPQREDIFRKIVLPGTLAPYQQAKLYAKVSGYLKCIKVDIGDTVKKGDVLAVIDVPEMEDEYTQAKAELLAAKSNHQLTKAEVLAAQAELKKRETDFRFQKMLLNRAQGLRIDEAITQQELDEAKAAFEMAKAKVATGEAELKVAKAKVDIAESKIEIENAKVSRLETIMAYSEIRAPFSGIITERFVDPGMLIQRGSGSQGIPLVTVMDTDTIRVFTDIPEPDVPYTKIGNPVKIVVDALKNREFQGTVSRFAQSLKLATRTMRTEIDLSNHDRVLLPGMYAKLTLSLDLHKNTVTIPADAIVVEKRKQFVYVVKNNQARKVAIEVGIDDGIKVEVLRGLNGNEDIIIAGKGLVSEGTRVQVARAASN